MKYFIIATEHIICYSYIKYNDSFMTVRSGFGIVAIKSL